MSQMAFVKTTRTIMTPWPTVYTSFMVMKITGEVS